jgi:hypothetical protein
MIKPIEITIHPAYSLLCKFSNGELKKLFVEPILLQEKNKKIADKILNPNFFNQVKLGELGQIYWQDAAEMKDEKGNTISCEYDLSPEFVYHYSVKVSV